MQGDDFALRQDFDIRRVRHAIHQILGDVVVQALTAHDDGHLAGVAGKMQRGLRGRVARAHHDDMFVAAKLRFARACAVIDSGAEQAILLRQTEAPILDARSADRHARNNFGPIVEVDYTLTRGEFPADPSAVNENLGSELCGLLSRTLSEIRAANPFRKTQIILNLRTSAGLAADSETFDKNGLQALRGAINRSA